MNLNIVSGVAIPASTKIGNTNPEYAVVAEKLKGMRIGDSFAVTADEAKKIRYIATQAGVTLTSRTMGENSIHFWRVEPRVKKVAAPAAEAASA